MKKFQFTLETYLKVKKMHEQQRLNDLAVVTGKIQTYQLEIRRNQQEAERLLKEESQRTRSGEFSLQRVLVNRNYFSVLRMRAQVAEQKIDELQGELKNKTMAWHKAQVERRAVELVKERRKAEYMVELNRAESQELDEFNSRKTNTSLLGVI